MGCCGAQIRTDGDCGPFLVGRHSCIYVGETGYQLYLACTTSAEWAKAWALLGRYPAVPDIGCFGGLVLIDGVPETEETAAAIRAAIGIARSKPRIKKRKTIPMDEFLAGATK